MAVLLYTPLDTDTVIPTSATVPTAGFVFGGTAIDTSTGFVVAAAGTYTLEDVATDNAKLVRVEWNLNCDLSSMINFALEVGGVVVRQGQINSELDGQGSIVLTRAEFGATPAGMKMKVWCADTDQTALNFLQLGSYVSVEVLQSAAI